MKKVFLSVALAAVTLGANAQVLKNNLLNGYKEGDSLEKAAYMEKTAAINKDVWSAAFTEKTGTGTISPVIGKPLTYPGYNEGGVSINLGFPEGINGYHSSVYSLTESGKLYAKGAYYLAFLVNISKLGSKELSEFLSLNGKYIGSSNRGEISFKRSPENDKRIKFGISLGKLKTEANGDIECNKTHLLVLKVDYTNNQVSLFINPSLKGDEPKGDAIINGDAVLKGGIMGLTFRNRSGHKGNIGNFRLTSSWAALNE